VNLYVLVEDSGSGKRVYKAWFKLLFPFHSEVDSVGEVTHNNYYLISGHGYPSYLDRIPKALSDIRDHGNIQHFIVCIDAEDSPRTEKLREIQEIAAACPQIASLHIVVHDCCLETWFLGHSEMMRRNPHSVRLCEYKRHYDVSRRDPELMNCIESSDVKAQFHYRYLKEMLSEQQLIYTKYSPGPVSQKPYFDALIQRYKTTNHIATFGEFIDICTRISSQTR